MVTVYSSAPSLFYNLFKMNIIHIMNNNSLRNFQERNKKKIMKRERESQKDRLLIHALKIKKSLPNTGS